MSLNSAATELSVAEAKNKFRESLPSSTEADIDALIALSLLLGHQEVTVGADHALIVTSMSASGFNAIVERIQAAGAEAWFSLLDRMDLPVESKARVKLVTSLAFGASFRPDAATPAYPDADADDLAMDTASRWLSWPDFDPGHKH